VDDHTLEKLNFASIRVTLSRYAQSALGRDLAARIAPSRKSRQINLWLSQARQFQRWMTEHGPPPFGGIRDVRDMVRRAVPPTILDPVHFADLASTLQAVEEVRKYLPPRDDSHAPIDTLAERLGNFSLIAERIGRVIDERGGVRDDASERLTRIRHEIERARADIRTVFDRLLLHPSTTRFLQYGNATYHADRMVLPVKAEQRGRVPGIIHGTSDSGGTLYIEPAEAVELNNRLIDLLQTEKEEINRILWELTHLVHLNQKEILRTLETLALIDLLSAKVRLALTYEMRFVEINDQHRVALRAARNPTLLLMHEGADPPIEPHPVVPIDVRLGDDFDIMMITGPNTGGKTAALKTVGLMALMTQAGLPIPVGAGSTLPVFSGIWIDIGDEQSLEQSLSTFSAHLARILDLLSRANKETIVLIDELGAGTDPDEGAAIGRAIVEHLSGVGCLGMVTTHLGALKALAFEIKRVDNASVQFDIETLHPTYELCIGEPGNSNAIAIASRLGMSKKLVHAARRHLTNQHRAFKRAIAGTLDARRNAERARRDAESARQEAARATLAALDRAKALEAERASYAKWLERVMSLQPGDTVRVKTFDREGKVVRVRLEKQAASVAIGAMEVDVALSDLIVE